MKKIANGMRRKAILIILALVAALMMGGCSSDNSKDGNDANTSSETLQDSVELSLDIESDGNLIFSKYDMDIIFDGNKLSTVSNGEKYSTTIRVQKGSHELKMSKSDDNTLFSVETINVEHEMSLSYFVKHGRNSIEIQNVKTIDSVDGQETSEVEKISDREKTEGETEIPTEKPTDKITVKQTEELTEKPTEKVTENITEKVTEKVTEEVTEEATERVTEKVTEKKTEEETEAEPVYEYVLNVNSGVFHLEGCRHERKMKSKNKKYVSATYSQMISWGYNPCDTCILGYN